MTLEFYILFLRLKKNSNQASSSILLLFDKKILSVNLQWT